jgi:hypothetical protein
VRLSRERRGRRALRWRREEGEGEGGTDDGRGRVKEGQSKGGLRFVISIDTDTHMHMRGCASRLPFPSLMYRAPFPTIDAHECARAYKKRCAHLLLLIPNSAYGNAADVDGDVSICRRLARLELQLRQYALPPRQHRRTRDSASSVSVSL